MRSRVTVVDFGTSKIVALIAEGEGARIDIAGAGMAAYDGYTDARWNNPEEVNKALQTALEKAEDQSRTKIRNVYLGVPGQFSTLHLAEGKVELEGADPSVTRQDIEKLHQITEEKVRDLRNQTLHASPAWFTIDDGKKTMEPIGQRGHEVRALFSHVKADQFFIADVTERLKDLGRTVLGCFSSSVSQATMLIPAEEKHKTAVLVDIGYLNTEVLAVEGDALIYKRVIPIGGGHMAADLAYGLDIPLESAEQIKRGFIFGDQHQQQNHEILGEGGVSQVIEREKSEKILLPRVDELCESISETISKSGVRLGNWSQVYLTGGGLAINRGGREYLSKKLGRPVRELPPRAIRLSNPIYSSALGLLDSIYQSFDNESGSRGSLRDYFRSLMGR